MVLLSRLACTVAAISASLGHQHSPHSSHDHHQHQHQQALLSDTATPPLLNGIPFSTRAHWMRHANAALFPLTGSPCPFAPFGTVIVNHTLGSSDPTHPGQVICTGANSNTQSGNPTLHGEMAAIGNCTRLLTDAQGEYRLSAREALAAFRSFTLYTNAEACPMCASAVRWAGFREYVFGTSIGRLKELGWGQIDIGSREVFERSGGLGGVGMGKGDVGGYSLLGDVLANETDGYFGWQFDDRAECPKGCARVEGVCEAVGDASQEHTAPS